MADEHVVFGPKAVEQIAKTVREVARMMQNPEGHRGRWQNTGAANCAVILDAALAVATNSKTGATSCLATVCEWDASISDYAESMRQITVWNHSESTAYAINTFGSAMLKDGHLWFFGDCAAMAAR